MHEVKVAVQIQVNGSNHEVLQQDVECESAPHDYATSMLFSKASQMLDRVRNLRRAYGEDIVKLRVGVFVRIDGAQLTEVATAVDEDAQPTSVADTARGLITGAKHAMLNKINGHEEAVRQAARDAAAEAEEAVSAWRAAAAKGELGMTAKARAVAEDVKRFPDLLG